MRQSKKRIQSKLHKIGTYDICKISLSCFDDKPYILEYGIESLAYFHRDVNSINIGDTSINWQYILSNLI